MANKSKDKVIMGKYRKYLIFGRLHFRFHLYMAGLSQFQNILDN